jgi:hypothetical protein
MTRVNQCLRSEINDGVISGFKAVVQDHLRDDSWININCRPPHLVKNDHRAMME